MLSTGSRRAACRLANRRRRGKKTPSLNETKGFDPNERKTSSHAANAAGTSRASYERAAAVVDAAEADPEKFRQVARDDVAGEWREVEAPARIESVGGDHQRRAGLLPQLAQVAADGQPMAARMPQCHADAAGGDFLAARFGELRVEGW
jgi:hypothetical protein